MCRTASQSVERYEDLTFFISRIAILFVVEVGLNSLVILIIACRFAQC